MQASSLLTALLIVVVTACAGRGSETAKGGGVGASDGAGAGGQEPGGCRLGNRCVGPCGTLTNYFCGVKCDGSPGQQAGLNCGRACVGLADEIQGGNCIPPQQDGGIYGRCREAGEEIEGKVVGAYCCDGLTRISQDRPSATGCAEGDAPPSILLCAACGDGQCLPYENSCNCPADCPVP